MDVLPPYRAVQTGNAPEAINATHQQKCVSKLSIVARMASVPAARSVSLEAINVLSRLYAVPMVNVQVA